MEDEDCGLAPIPNLFQSSFHYPAIGPNSVPNDSGEWKFRFCLSLPTPALFCWSGYQPMSPRLDLQEGLPLTCCVCICASQGGDRGCQNISPGACEHGDQMFMMLSG